MGSLTHPGDAVVQDEPMPGLVWAFRFDSDGAAEELDVDQPITRHHGWTWLHYNLVDTRACQTLASISSLPASARKLLISADEHQQFHRSDTCIYGMLADLVCGLDGFTEEIGFLHFAMTENLVISARRRQLNAIETTRRAVREGLKVTTPTALFQVITEQMIESVDHYADGLANHLDRVEEKILADYLSIDRQVIVQVRRMTVRLHRQLVTLRSLIHRLEQDGEPSSDPALRTAMQKLGQRLDWLDTEIVALRDRSYLLQEEITLKTAEQTNRNLHVLAMVTTVFLPASLVAGIFGMNVDLPLDRKSGFMWAVVILIAAAALVYWWLKRSGIRGR